MKLLVPETPMGVDISHRHGDVDWKMVHAAGYDFAFLKASEGIDTPDRRYMRNWDEAQHAGLLVGAYHLARVSNSPTIELNAKIQANFFASRIRDQVEHIPPALDVEWDRATRGLQPIDIVHWCLTFAQQLTMRTMRVPIIRTSYHFWYIQLLRTPLLALYPLWLDAPTHDDAPTCPAAWSRWTFWHRQQQTLPGSIATPVDISWFNGNLDALRQLAGVTAPIEVSTAADTMVEEVPDPPLPHVQNSWDVFVSRISTRFASIRKERFAPVEPER